MEKITQTVYLKMDSYLERIKNFSKLNSKRNAQTSPKRVSDDKNAHESVFNIIRQ